jgi:hypothetical protein
VDRIADHLADRIANHLADVVHLSAPWRATSGW